MSEIILDLGSGSNAPYMKDMVDEVIARDTGKHCITFKVQLFKSAPPNVPLSHDAFGCLYDYVHTRGYDLTSSVFDMDSLNFLLDFEVPFVKIACRPELYWLLDDVPAGQKVYISGNVHGMRFSPDVYLLCIPEYPAPISEYERRAMKGGWDGISDHTVGLELWNRLRPDKFEKHLKLPDSTGPDAGEWAITPTELEAVL
jgi:sialic acid synthase SpsE